MDINHHNSGHFSPSHKNPQNLAHVLDIVHGVSPTRSLGNSVKSLHTLSTAELPEHFNKQAVKNMRSVVRGRHPKSLPRNSELWHYSKLSAVRKMRVNKGHQFWEVIGQEEHLHDGQHHEHHLYNNSDDDLTQGSYTIGTGNEISHASSQPNSRIATSSINSQLKHIKLNNSSIKENLELKIDWKNKGQINFGMAFIIMNYMNELLYVNKYGELRCKEMHLIESTDRIKFKMIDLINPSNPSSLKFGDSMWLQCLDASETGGFCLFCLYDVMSDLSSFSDENDAFAVVKRAFFFLSIIANPILYHHSYLKLQ
jgi:hypothetical protein